MESIRNNINKLTTRSYEQFSNIKNNVENTIKNVGESMSNVTNNISERLEEFGPNNQENRTVASSFINSNSLVAKFTFIILVFLIFIILCNLGTSIIAYFTQPNLHHYFILCF